MSTGMSRKNRSSRGATMVEFVLTILVVLFVFFLLIECCLWIYCYNVMADAAKAGVRYAIVHGSGVSSGSQSGPTSGTAEYCSDSDSSVQPVIDEVKKWASFSAYDTTGMTVNVCYLDGNNEAPNRVRVTVLNPVVPIFSFWGTAPVKAAAQGRIVN